MATLLSFKKNSYISYKLFVPGAATQAIHSAEDNLGDLNHKIKNSDLYARTEANAGKSGHEHLIRPEDESNNVVEHRAVFPQPLIGDNHKDMDPSQQWGLDWKQYGNKGIDHSGSDMKTGHSMGEYLPFYFSSGTLHFRTSSLIVTYRFGTPTKYYNINNEPNRCKRWT